MRISDWSSDVCSSDLLEFVHAAQAPAFAGARRVHFRANTASKAATPARGPSGWPNTAPLTARKSAPAFTSGAAFSAVMPPMATQGSSNRDVHQPRIDGTGRSWDSLIVVGYKATKATSSATATPASIARSRLSLPDESPVEKEGDSQR